MAVDVLRSNGKLEGDALLSEYVQRYRRLVERLCRILLSDSNDAEDATQQTFLLAYQSLLAGTRPHHPRAWLCTIARRECWARDHRRRRERAVPPAETRAEPDPAERTVLRAELATMSAGLKELPARQRQAIVLRELAGLSYTQLAATLEVSESAAEALLVRARRNLREARLGLVLLLPSPRSLRRLLRLGSGHARTAVGLQAAKGVAVVTLVTATTAVAGSTVPAQPAASHPPTVAHRAAPQTRHVRTAPHHAVAPSRPAVRSVPHAHVELKPARPAVSPARLIQPAPSSSPSTAAVATPAAPAAPSAPQAAGPQPSAQAPTTGSPRPQPAAPAHPKPAAKPTPAAPVPLPTPTTTTTEPDQPATTTPPPTDTTETPPPPGDGSQSPDGQSAGSGDSKPGNGYGDNNHEHDGDNHHGPH